MRRCMEDMYLIVATKQDRKCNAVMYVRFVSGGSEEG